MTTGERDPARDNDDWPLGQLIHQARIARGPSGRPLPYSTIADKAGVSRELVWQMEHGRRRDGQLMYRFRPPHLQSVARVLGIDEWKMLELAGHNPSRYLTPAADGASPLASQEQITEWIFQLRERERRAVETLLRSLLGYDEEAVESMQMDVIEDDEGPGPTGGSGPTSDAEPD